jgi:hypothetical protein
MVTGDVVRLLTGTFFARMVHHVRRSSRWPSRVVMRILVCVGRHLRYDRARQKLKGDRNCQHFS